MGEPVLTLESARQLLLLSAHHMDFLSKMLRNSRTVRKVGDKKSIPAWQAAADEAAIGAEKIRAALSAGTTSTHPRTSDPAAPADASGRNPTPQPGAQP